MIIVLASGCHRKNYYGRKYLNFVTYIKQKMAETMIMARIPILLSVQEYSLNIS